MLDRLLNRTCDVYRYSNTKNESGDVSNTLSKIASSVKMRITTNKKTSDDGGVEAGRMMSSTHLIFCKKILTTPTTIIYLKPGDIIQDITTPPTQNIVKYTVDFFDALPGGEPDSHWQIYATMVEPE